MVEKVASSLSEYREHPWFGTNRWPDALQSVISAIETFEVNSSEMSARFEWEKILCSGGDLAALRIQASDAFGDWHMSKDPALDPSCKCVNCIRPLELLWKRAAEAVKTL